MQLKTNSTFGNYKFDVTAEVSEKQVEVLAGLGLLQLLQRTPASAAEKKLAGYEKKRPDGFKRTDIAYSEDGAKVLKGFLESAQLDVAPEGADKEELEALAIEATVTEHVPGEGATPKFTREREIYAKRGTEGRLDELASKVGFAGDVGDGTADNAPVEFLRAMKVWLDAKAKELLA